MFNLALNQDSCRKNSIDQFIKISKDFYGIELNFKKIKKSLSQKYSIKELKELLEIYNLKICSFFELKNFSLCSEKEFKSEILKHLKELLFYCEKFESDLIIVQPSNLENFSSQNTILKTKIINKTRKRLNAISKLSDEEDICVGFEFLADNPISSLKEAVNLIEPLKYQENLGLIIDTYHLILNNSDYTQLDSIRDLIYLIQLSDVEYDTEASDKNEEDKKKVSRLLPGEGAFDFQLFFDYMRKIGYKKPYSLELDLEGCEHNLYQQFFRKFF